MKTCVLLAAAAAAGYAIAPKPSTYTDGTYGFTIQAPPFAVAAEGSSALRVLMFDPAESGFSANVNVVVQHVSMTADEYRDLTLKQFKEAGFKLHTDSKKKVSGRDALVFDYEGTQQGQEMRFLSLAVIEKSRVFLATCTALKADFEKQAKGFNECLDSLTFTD